MPRPPDIPFDHVAAGEAIAALDRALSVLGQVAGVRTTAAGVAIDGFRGAYADDFATGNGDLRREGDDAEADIRDLRAAIATAVDAALRAQQVRQGEQAAWDVEQATPTPVGVA